MRKLNTFGPDPATDLLGQCILILLARVYVISVFSNLINAFVVFFTTLRMAEADIEYGSSSICYFPLIHWLKPLPVEWMLVLYAIMFLGAFGVMIGFKYRYSCLCFTIPYWYIFILDKTTWNNHSYLYGLISLQFLLFDANHFMYIFCLKNSIFKEW